MPHPGQWRRTPTAKSERHPPRAPRRDGPAARAGALDGDGHGPPRHGDEDRGGEPAGLPVGDDRRVAADRRRQQRVERVPRDHRGHAQRTGGVERGDAGVGLAAAMARLL